MLRRLTLRLILWMVINHRRRNERAVRRLIDRARRRLGPGVFVDDDGG